MELTHQTHPRQLKQLFFHHDSFARIPTRRLPAISATTHHHIHLHSPKMDSNNHRRRLHRSRPEKDKEPEKEKENMGLVRRRDSFGLKGLKRSYSSSSTIASSSAYHLTRSPLHPLSFPSTSDTIPPHPTYDFTKLNARAPEDLTMHPGTKFVIPPVQDPYSDPMNDNPPSKVSSTHSKGSRESTATPKSEHPSRQFNSPPPLNIHPSSISSTVNLGSSNVNQNPLGDGKKKVSTAQRTYGSTSTTSLIPTNLLFFPDNAPAPDNGMYTSSSSTPGRKDSNTNTTPRALESINASSGRLNVFGPNSTPSGSVLTPPADSRGKWLGKVFKRCGHTKDDKKENQSGKSPPKAVIDSSPSPGYPPKIVVNSPPKESGDSLPKIAGSYFQQIKGGPLPKIKDSSLLPPKTADKLKYKANLDDLFERAVTLGIELEPNTTNRSIDPAIQPANYDPPAATLILDERSIVKLDNLPKHWEKARSEGLWERIFEFVSYFTILLSFQISDFSY